MLLFLKEIYKSLQKHTQNLDMKYSFTDVGWKSPFLVLQRQSFTKTCNDKNSVLFIFKLLYLPFRPSVLL